MTNILHAFISCLILILTVFFPFSSYGEPVNLDTLEGLRFHNVSAELVDYQGRAAIKVSEPADGHNLHEDKLVILDELQFKNGIIELDIAGAPRQGAKGGARGFVGVAFNVAEDVSSFDAIYLRPTNGRADDQQRRNHSTQYFAFPDYPWYTLREDTPGRYESYVDLVPGEWTHIRIEISGDQALLYVHDADQPTLIVNQLMSGQKKGAIGLWIGPDTDAYFTNLDVTAHPH